MRARNAGLPAVAISAVVAVIMVALAVTMIVGGVHDLSREPTCGGRTMSSIDGCEVLSGNTRGSHDIQLYWPGGLMAGGRDSIPADRHLSSRDQMRSSAREHGIVSIVIGAGFLVPVVWVGWRIVRRGPWRRPPIR